MNDIETSNKKILIWLIAIGVLVSVFGIFYVIKNNSSIDDNNGKMQREKDSLKEIKNQKKIEDSLRKELEEVKNLQRKQKLEDEKTKNAYIDFETFSKDYLKKIMDSKTYFLQNATNILEIYITKGNKSYSETNDKNFEYSRIKGDLEVLLTYSKNDTKISIGSSTILVDRFIMTHRGMKLLFDNKSSSGWMLYRIEYFEPFFIF